MKTENVGLAMGLWVGLVAYFTGVLGPLRSLMVAMAVYVTVVIMNWLLKEHVKREIEKLAELEESHD